MYAEFNIYFKTLVEGRKHYSWKIKNLALNQRMNCGQYQSIKNQTAVCHIDLSPSKI